METGAGTNTYLVGDLVGGCVVVDPGPASDEHLQHVEELARARGGLRAILVTHGHEDHRAGAAQLRTFSAAPLYAGSLECVPDVDQLLYDGATIEIGSTLLEALHTPGHSGDHFCFWLPAAGTLFAGDLVAGEGTVVIAPPDGDMAAYLDSLRRVLALPVRIIYPGHGPVIDRPRSLLEGYVQHRQEREAQIRSALGVGEHSAEQLIDAVYTTLDDALRPLAAQQITAHLLKLEREGLAVRHETPGGKIVWRQSGG